MTFAVAVGIHLELYSCVTFVSKGHRSKFTVKDENLWAGIFRCPRSGEKVDLNLKL